MAYLSNKKTKLIKSPKRKITDRKKFRNKYYCSSQWQNLRKWLVMENPLCIDCLEQQVITPTEDLHHLKSPFEDFLTEEERWQRLLDPKNVVPLCKYHHSMRHNNKKNNIFMNDDDDNEED